VEQNTREIREREYKIHCPVCGKFMYRIFEGKVAFSCDKCHTCTVVICKNGKLTMFEEEEKLASRKKVETA